MQAAAGFAACSSQDVASDHPVVKDATVETCQRVAESIERFEDLWDVVKFESLGPGIADAA
jgi:hypothetical protein